MLGTGFHAGALSWIHKKEAPLFLACAALIAYLLFGVGLFSDDFSDLNGLRQKGALQILLPIDSPFLNVPVAHYSTYVWYYFGAIDDATVVSAVKTVYAILSFYFMVGFFGMFLTRSNAILVSWIFLFFPSHDGTIYFLQSYYLTLSFAFYLRSYYLAHHNRLVQASGCAFIGSFISYGSLPVALSLGVLFVLHSEFKKALILLVPNAIYTFYLLFVTTILDASSRVLEASSAFGLLKQFVLQIVTFADAVGGPSMWLKILYALPQLSLLSVVVGTIVTVIFYRTAEDIRESYNPKVIASLLVLTVAAFAIYAITGRYPQLAFGLGNRTTIFGSLLVSYLVVLIPVQRKWRTLCFGAFVFVALGISDHWKAWDQQQRQVIHNIANNEALRGYTSREPLYVSGNQYSQYGPLSHVEFLSEGWVTGGLFAQALDNPVVASPLTKRHRYENGYLVDTKYQVRSRIDGRIQVYDSESDELLSVPASQIGDFIDSLPQENRHWIMLEDSPFTRYVKGTVVWLMPRLGYAFR